MYLIRVRKVKVSSFAALVAALVLIATEVFAGSSGITHMMDGVIILN